MRKVVLLGLVALISSAGAASAADLITKAPKAVPALPSWWDTVTITGHLEAGVTFNGARPSDGINFGRLFTDKTNSLLLNQALQPIHRKKLN